MPYTMQDHQRDYAKRHFTDLTQQERLECLSLLTVDARRELLSRLPADVALYEALKKVFKLKGQQKGPKRRSRRSPSHGLFAEAIMQYTSFPEFEREYVKEHFKDLTTQEQCGLIVALPAAERREMHAALLVDELLDLLPRERIEQLLKQREEQRGPRKRSRRA